MLQQAIPGFRHELAEHYRGRGYQVHEGRKVRGRSGAVYAIDMVVQAPFGNLVIQFDDDGELGPAEVSAVRAAAKDIGATAVIASRRVTGMVRHAATRLGVVVVDENNLHEEAIKAPEVSDPTEEWAPWPGSAQEREPDWPTEREEAPGNGIAKERLDAPFQARHKEAADRFGWLRPSTPHPSPAPEPAGRPAEQASAPPREARLLDQSQDTLHVAAPLPRPVPGSARPTWWPALVAGSAAGIVGGGLFFLLAWLLL